MSPARRPSDPTARLDDDSVPTRHQGRHDVRIRRGRARDPGTSVPAPLVLDRYALQQRMGTGAFGTVWMARDEHLERDVAVKILARELVSGGRFEREARAAARLSHPGIVTLYEAAVDDEGAYLVSELVRGETLDALLRDGRLSDRDIVAIGVGLCDALAHAHEQGVVHRDVKPSNVLVPRSGRSTRAPCKLTDFGVARVIDSDSLTLTGDVIGTLNYMAPEQAAGLEAGEAADLYALALVVYEALSGVNPLRNSPSARNRHSRATMHLPPLRRQRRDLPAPLADAIDRALRPRVDERGTLAELRDGLAGAIEDVGVQAGVVAGAFDREPGADGDGAVATRLFSPRRRDEDDDRGRGPDRAADPLPGPDPSRLAWQARALAGAGAAASAAWLEHVILRPHGALTAPIALVALIAGGLSVLVPRIGWPALAAYVCVAAAIQGHAGTAALVAAGALVPMVLLPASPMLWPLSAAAPALGFAGIAGAWPALAGWAHRPWRRVMLGAAGWLWLMLAEPLAGRTLYEPRPGLSVDRATWVGSIIHAVQRVLVPLARDGRLAPAVVWAAAALVLPYIVRRGRPLVGIAAAVVWSAAVAIAVPIAIDAAARDPHAVGPALPVTVAGAVAAVALACGPLLLDAGRRTRVVSSLAGRTP